jgi:hypothetical protein
VVANKFKGNFLTNKKPALFTTSSKTKATSQTLNYNRMDLRPHTAIATLRVEANFLGRLVVSVYLPNPT